MILQPLSMKLDYTQVLEKLGSHISSFSKADDILNKNFSKAEKRRVINPYNYMNPRDADAAMFAIDYLYEMDKTLFNHCFNVAIFAAALGKEINLYNYEILFLGGLLHDIGKTLIPCSILYKSGKLTSTEFKVIQKHPLLGSYFLFKNGMYNPCILDMVKLHHVYFDGSGYPRKPNIKSSIYTQIITICDAFDAMCSERVYSERKTLEEAKKELIKRKGTQFNPDLINVFLEKAADFYPATQVKKSF